MHTPIKESRVDRRLCRVKARIIFDLKKNRQTTLKVRSMFFTSSLLMRNSQR